MAVPVMPDELVVEAEEVLQGDRGERLVLVLDLHALLGLDGLVHALVVAAAGQHAAGVLVDDEHLAVDDDVVLVLLEQFLGLDGVVQVADQRGVHRLVEVLDAQPVLDLGDALLVDGDRALLLVDVVVAGLRDLALERSWRPRRSIRRVTSRANSPYHLVAWSAGPEMISGVRASSMRIESTSSTIGEVVAALHQLVLRPRHVVAQVVEAELVVRAVGDVAGVLLAALRPASVGEDRADGQAEEAVHAAHQVGVALGQVVVDGDDVHALAGQRVEVGRAGGDEGLALAGAHLGDVAQVQRRAAHDLHVVVPLAQRALGGLADRGERLGQDVVEGLAVGEPLRNSSVMARSSASVISSKSASRALTWSAMRCSLRRILPSPVRKIFERTDTGVGLLAGRAWDGRLPLDLLSNGHRMRGPHRAGRACCDGDRPLLQF